MGGFINLLRSAANSIGRTARSAVKGIRGNSSGRPTPTAPARRGGRGGERGTTGQPERSSRRAAQQQRTQLSEIEKLSRETGIEVDEIKRMVQREADIKSGKINYSKIRAATGAGGNTNIGTKDSAYFLLNQEEKEELWRLYNEGIIEKWQGDNLRGEDAPANFI